MKNTIMAVIKKAKSEKYNSMEKKQQEEDKSQKHIIHSESID